MSDEFTREYSAIDVEFRRVSQRRVSEQTERRIMNELVERLTNGSHPIVASRSASPGELREQIERGFVLLKFPDTRGGTELGSQLDREQTRLDGADFANATGSVHLVGNLTLNYDKVRLVADIDLNSLTGAGHLVLIEAAANGSSAFDESNDDSAGNEGNGAHANGENLANDSAGKPKVRTSKTTRKRVEQAS
jgi:hypothetical protein